MDSEEDIQTVNSEKIKGKSLHL